MLKARIKIGLLGVFFLLAGARSLFAESAPSLDQIKKLYPEWQKNLQEDYRQFLKKAVLDKAMSLEDVSSQFPRSIQAASKAAQVFQGVQNKELKGDSSRHYQPYSDILVDLLKTAQVAGEGGYLEQEEAYLVYLKLEDSETQECNPYSKNPVPTQKGLVRGAYPFALFNVKEGKLRLVSLSKEINGIVACLKTRQFL